MGREERRRGEERRLKWRGMESRGERMDTSKGKVKISSE